MTVSQPTAADRVPNALGCASAMTHHRDAPSSTFSASSILAVAAAVAGGAAAAVKQSRPRMLARGRIATVLQTP